MEQNTNKVSFGTLARTIVLALALFNQIMVNMGKPIIDIDEGTVTEFVNLGITIAAAVAAWWYNNSFTTEAIQADQEHVKLQAENKE